MSLYNFFRPEIGIENGGTVDCETCCARPECSQDLCNHQEHRSSPDQVIEPWIVNLVNTKTHIHIHGWVDGWTDGRTEGHMLSSNLTCNLSGLNITC